MITEDQIKMLNGVKQAFIDNPSKLNMSNWCGTTHCIAGELVYQNNIKLWGEVYSNISRVICIQNEACKLLDVVLENNNDFGKIFFAVSWPFEFAKEYMAREILDDLQLVDYSKVEVLKNVIDSYIAYRSQDKIINWQAFEDSLNNVAQ